MRGGDTIVALASGAPPSGVAVIRVSGPAARESLEMLAGGAPEPRRLALRRIRGETPIDRGLVAFFPGPASFTGEDCAEFHIHGSPAGVRALLGRLTAQPGVRLAEAGEFTRRAFENGKLDLTEIEGLGDLLAAETENQRKQALARFEGGLTQRLEGWRDRLVDLRAEIEARLDFSDEDDVPDSFPPAFEAELAALAAELAEAGADWGRGRILREGVRVALAGAPNAGKSSLLNALARSGIAIVTPEAGTTRDVREVPLDIGGQLVMLVDLAGLRDADSLAEAEGIRRAHAEIARADLVLWLIGPESPEESPAAPDETPLWRLATKADLGQPSVEHDLAISVIDGQGLIELRARLSDFVGGLIGTGEPSLIGHERDRLALTAAAASIHAARQRMERSELAAEDLRAACQSLERLLGRLDVETVLDRLFSSFCIGK